MNKLTNIMDESVYLARDYSSIIRWFVKKLKYLTQDWTDLSVSEPDTMSLSYIAYVFDLLNYLVDKKFINTIFSRTTSVRFLSYLYKLVGSELIDYNSGKVIATVTNLSNETMYIKRFSILRMEKYHNELFTVLNDYEIQGKTNLQIEVIRGTPIYYNCNKSDMINGYFVLPDKNINRNLISVLIDGTTEISKVDDAIFSLVSSFEVSQSGEYYTSIRLSPKAWQTMESSVIVIYNLNDDFLIAENSKLVMLETPNNEYEIVTNTTNKVDSVDIKDMKSRYYEILSKINVLYNEQYDISQLKSGRIDYLNYNYQNNSIFKSGSIDYVTGELIISLVSNPKNKCTIVYKITNNEGSRISKSITKELLEENTITLDIVEGYMVEPMSVLIKYDDEIINDCTGLSNLILVNGNTSLVINYSTYDDNPITPLIKEGEVNYIDSSVSIVFNYISSTEVIISYEVSTKSGTDSRKEFINITDLSTYLVLNVNSNESLIKNSMIITNGYNIIKDNNGKLSTVQSDKDILIKDLSDKILINRTTNDIILSKLFVKKINIRATVYLYPSDLSTSDILKDIQTALYNAYHKGSNEPGVTIKRLPILLTIESSNPAIKYATLESPSLDISIDSSQISELGSVNIVFERSDD